jgi:RNA polymerase sigma-32 factor
MSSDEQIESTGALDVYMRDLRRYPMVTREREEELARQYSRTHDPRIAHRLITANLRLVVKIAYQYRRSRRSLIDLVQEGNEGLVQAVLRYDPNRGVKLSSFAAWWIRARMLKSILNDSRLVKLGTTQAQRKLFFNLRKEQEKLEAAGFEVTDSMLAEKMSVTQHEVSEMRQRLAGAEASLDAPVASEDGMRTVVDLLQGNSALRPDVIVEDREFHGVLCRRLREFEKTLSGRSLMLFRHRLMAEQPKTLKEIGEAHGISRERMRQIEVGLLARLKAFLERELGGSPQVALSACN